MHRIPQLRWLALLLAVFVLAGCDVWQSQHLKPVPKTLTHARLVYLADKACRTTFRKHDPFEHPKNRGQLVKEFQFVTSALDHLTFELRGLKPPPSDAVAYRRFLAAVNQQDLVATHFVEGIGDQPVLRLKEELRHLERISKRVDNRAKTLGMKECAKD